MRKFNKPTRPFTDRKKPGFKPKSDSYKRDKNSSDGEDKKDKGDYKSKRPFSKDRDFKSKDGDREKRPYKSKSEGGGRDFKSKDGYKKKSFGSSDKDGDREKRPYKSRSEGGDRDFKSKDGYKKKSFGSSEKDGDREKRPYKSRGEGGDFKEKRSYKPRGEGENKNTEAEEEKKLSYKQKRSFTRNKEFREIGGFKKDSDSFDKRGFKDKEGDDHRRPFKRDYEKKDFKAKKTYGDDKPFKRKFDDESGKSQKRVKHDEFEEGGGFTEGFKKEFSDDKKFSKKSSEKSNDGTTRLNKYLAHAGIASRREADTLIQSGVVKVNGIPITEMGYKVKSGDVVTYGDAAVKNERKVYLLLNKPKDYISTVDDPQERKTVMELLKGACKERIYPVGRLDRNTTGLLLFTNDGELTKKLTHPKHNIKKLYHVSLNKGLTSEDFAAIKEGVELEDGPIKADDLAFVGEGKKEIGIEIHSGRNRIVRRLFEHLGYEVLKLDRITFAGLNKKDLARGKFRFLTQKEINFLQMIG